MMKIRIKTLEGGEHDVEVSASDKVIQLKQQIEQKLHIPPPQQALIFLGKRLEDDQTLESYQVTNECAIHLIQIGGGGGALPPPPHPHPHLGPGPVYPSGAFSGPPHPGFGGGPPPPPGMGGPPPPPGMGGPPPPPGMGGPPPPFHPFARPPVPPQGAGGRGGAPLPTTTCPYCALQMAYFPGSQLIKCPRCLNISELRPVVMKVVACGRCGVHLQYPPHATLIKCTACGVHVSTVPLQQLAPPHSAGPSPAVVPAPAAAAAPPISAAASGIVSAPGPEFKDVKREVKGESVGPREFEMQPMPSRTYASSPIPGLSSSSSSASSSAVSSSSSSSSSSSAAAAGGRGGGGGGAGDEEDEEEEDLGVGALTIDQIKRSKKKTKKADMGVYVAL